VDFKLTDGKSPVLFVVDGYQLVVMPMLTAGSQKSEDEAEQAEAEPAEDTEPLAEDTEAEQSEEAEAVAEAEAVVKAEKPKRSRKKEPVAVA